jgi:hypothetical protein
MLEANPLTGLTLAYKYEVVKEQTIKSYVQTLEMTGIEPATYGLQSHRSPI